MTRILVVEDSRTQALQVQVMLENAGFTVSMAGNGKEALEVLKQGLPDIVLSDVQMPHMNGLELVEAVCKEYPGLPVVIMTALGSEDIASRALQAGASSYIPKRDLDEYLVSTLEDILAVSQASQREKLALGCLEKAEFHFVLDNDSALIAPLIGHLEDTVVHMGHCDRTELMRVAIALHESLLNAIQHGNLEVSSDLRQEQDEKAFRAVIEERRRQPPYRDRRVRLAARLMPAQAVYTITDEGPGFDPTSLPDPTDPSNLERIGGRGLMLIRTFMDDVQFNERGNQITLTKRHRGR